MINIKGKPNRPAPPSFNLDLEEFTSGAVSAVSLVTHDMVSDQWDALPDLVEPHCLSSMKGIIASLSEEEKQLICLDKEDVFFSFISNLHDCDDGNNIHLVTLSLPKLGKNMLINKDV